MRPDPGGATTFGADVWPAWVDATGKVNIAGVVKDGLKVGLPVDARALVVDLVVFSGASMMGSSTTAGSSTTGVLIGAGRAMDGALARAAVSHSPL